MTNEKHGGGPSGKITVDDTVTEVSAFNKNRKYFEVINGGSERCYLSLGATDAAVDSGLFLEPLATYSVNFTNLTSARISAICAPGLDTDLYWQQGQ
jgi:hypothetical protein